MGEVQLTCLSLKERLPFVLTFWLCLIIMKFLVLLFSLLLVLACGFSLVRFFTNSFRSLLPAWKNQKQTIKNKQTKYETRLVHQTSLNALWIMQCMTCAAYFQAFFFLLYKEPKRPGVSFHVWKGQFQYHCCSQTCFFIRFGFLVEFFYVP